MIPSALGVGQVSDGDPGSALKEELPNSWPCAPWPLYLPPDPPALDGSFFFFF